MYVMNVNNVRIRDRAEVAKAERVGSVSVNEMLTG
jgi:hypothetical protein